MSKPYTFTITVQEIENRIPRYVDADLLRDYLWTLIESESQVSVLNIVRDY